MFKLPPLPYSEEALAPHMSADTLRTHHGKHHAAYIKKMNAALEERSDAPATLEEVVRLAAREKDKKLFNNAAQAWNHAFFWNSMTPHKQAAPQGALAAAIDKQFGGLEAFIGEARPKGENHFASGWLWLNADKTGALQMTDLHDADTPIVDPAVTPIFVVDVWEHAYYLDHKNDRAAFLKGWFENLINWRFAESQYDAALSGQPGYRFPS